MIHCTLQNKKSFSGYLNECICTNTIKGVSVTKCFILKGYFEYGLLKRTFPIENESRKSVSVINEYA